MICSDSVEPLRDHGCCKGGCKRGCPAMLEMDARLAKEVLRRLPSSDERKGTRRALMEKP